MVTKPAHFIGMFLVFTFVLIFAVIQLKSNLKTDPLEISLRRTDRNPLRFEERKMNLKKFCGNKLQPKMPTKENNQIYAEIYEGYHRLFQKKWSIVVLKWVRNSARMTIGKTHPTLLLTQLLFEFCLKLSYRLNEISIFGISKSNIPFYFCLAPKVGSTTLTTILLETTGFFDDETKQPTNVRIIC